MLSKANNYTQLTHSAWMRINKWMIKIFLIVTDKQKTKTECRKKRNEVNASAINALSVQCNQIISKQTMVLLKNGKFVISLVYWLVVFTIVPALYMGWLTMPQRTFSIRAMGSSLFLFTPFPSIHSDFFPVHWHFVHIASIYFFFFNKKASILPLRPWNYIVLFVVQTLHQDYYRS